MFRRKDCLYCVIWQTFLQRQLHWDHPTLQGIKGNFPYTLSRTPPVSISNQESQMDILFRNRWSKGNFYPDGSPQVTRSSLEGKKKKILFFYFSY